MKKNFHLILFLFFYSISQIIAQKDTPFLKTDELGVEDLKLVENQFSNQKVVSASRSLQDLEDLPYTIYIISKEEIQEKGYNTLVDALKWIPGIRVSQPGSGLEGETFMMRGLQGNTYAKILINGISIKPYATRGMPIGAQLPIREAERIEVIFGPAAAVYGADASAGIINIITMESDRPLYTTADISLGAQEYSSIHALFGGKLGEGNKILKYKIFGSYTFFKNRKIFHDTLLLFNPEQYDPTRHYIENQNFDRRINPTPHDSRLIGIELNYRKMSAHFYNMIRRDHASLGLNQTAASYANPHNFIRDEITAFRFSWNPDWGKWGMKFNVGGLVYQKDGTSSHTYVENNLKRLFDHTIPLVSSPMQVGDRIDEVYEEYFEDERFSYAASFEPETEALAYYKPLDQLEILIGLRGINSGASISDYLERPITDRSPIIDGKDYSFLGTTGFVQAYLNTQKVKGVLSFNRTVSENYDSRINPRVSLLFPLAKGLSIRAFYGTAFRVPSAFYYANTYNVWLNDYANYYDGKFGGFETNINQSRNNVIKNLQPEENSTFELGLRLSNSTNFSLDVNAYYNKTENSIAYQELVPRRVNFVGAPPDSILFFTTGYSNFGDSHLIVYGLQSLISMNFDLKNKPLKVRLGLNFSQGERKLPGAFDITIDDTFEQPKFSAQFQLEIPFGENWKLYLDNLYHSESLSDVAAFDARLTGDFDRNTLIIPSYYTLDWVLRWKISRHFQAYMQVNNFFNKKYGGLSATGTPDDLFYNAQSRRIWRVGMSYRLE